jgi:Ca2+-binding RTX toxin-like protein
VILGPGIVSDAIAARASGADLIVDVSSTDRITLKNWLSDPKYRVDFFRFSDGSSLNEAQIADLLNVRQGTMGNDVLAGTDAGNERMYGRAGNDTLTGLGGNDLLEGGPGSDLLDGGPGDDVYPVSIGDGSDLIRDGAGADAIRFGSGVSASDVTFGRSANDLVLRIAGGDDTVMIENYLRNLLARVETLLFVDGSSLPDAETIVEQLTAIRGTAGADSISGTAYSDRLYGLDGNDTLLGGADDDELHGDSGADSLAGGPGADVLSGGTGFDRYQFNAADGSDSIVDPDADSVVSFGAGIARKASLRRVTGTTCC